jgi:hypothetical protein
MRFFVFVGMNRARGASFSTNETVVDENPLARATSRMVTDEFFCLLRFTIEFLRHLQIARGMIHLLALVVENSSWIGRGLTRS